MFVRRKLLQALLVLCSSAAIAQTATVKPEKLPILREPANTAASVGSVSRGDVVNVELSISSVEGEWCFIRAAKTPAAGYVDCTSLERPEPTPATASQAPIASSAATLTDAALANNDCSALSYASWIKRYEFTFDQTRFAEQVASEIGLYECSRKAEPFKERFAANPTVANKMRLLQQWTKVDPSNSCERAARKFWPRVRPTMTDEQIAKMKADMIVLRKNVLLIAMDPEKCIPIFCLY